MICRENSASYGSSKRKSALCHSLSGQNLGKMASSKYPKIPMKEEELFQCACLLRRVILGEQVPQLRAIYMQRISEAANYELTKVLEEVVTKPSGSGLGGGMSEAVKRLRGDQSDGEATEGAESEGWSKITTSEPPTPSDAFVSDLSLYDQQDLKVPLPDNCKSAVSWGRTICRMEKFKKNEWSYDQMLTMSLSESPHSGEIRDYFRFLLSRYATGGKVPDRITPAVDLSMFLERIRWKQKIEETLNHGSGQSSKNYTFKRETK